MDAGTRSFPGRSQREPAGRRRAPNRPAITTGTESTAPQRVSAQCSGKPIAKPRAMIRALTTARTRMIHIAAEGTAAPGADHADSPVSRPNREEGDSELLVGRETVREQHRDESGGDDRAGKDDPHEAQGYRGTDRSPAPAVGAPGLEDPNSMWHLHTGPTCECRGPGPSVYAAAARHHQGIAPPPNLLANRSTSKVTPSSRSWRHRQQGPRRNGVFADHPFDGVLAARSGRVDDPTVRYAARNPGSRPDPGGRSGVA